MILYRCPDWMRHSHECWQMASSSGVPDMKAGSIVRELPLADGH